MPTVIIPCGGDYEPTGSPYDESPELRPVRGHFTLDHASTDVDHRWIALAHTTAPVGALDSTDTGSYISADEDGYNAAVEAEIGHAGDYDLVLVGAQSAPFTPGFTAEQITNIRSVVIARTTGSHPFQLGARTVPNTTGLPEWSLPSSNMGPLDGEWRRYATEHSIASWLFTWETRAVPLLAQGLMYVSLDISQSFKPARGVIDAAWFAIEIDYTLPVNRRLAHNRGMQRGSDGQGVTGGKRGLQRKSRQSSLRGGSFL